jgi:Methylamine utilisation protein MauE
MSVGVVHVLGVAGVDTLNAAREVQIPVLAALLLGSCAAKARRAVSMHSIEAGISPTAVFPHGLRRPMAIALCASELFLGVGLVVTAGRIGAGLPATAVRCATALLFATAVGVLHELRGRQPTAGCGCFGELSDTPTGWRTMARSALLCAAAVATVGVPPLHKPVSAGQAIVVLTVAAAEFAVLAALSPEIGEIMVRLGYSEPCEVRRLPVPRTLAALRASAPWRRYRHYLVSTEPIDVWREGCWRYVVFPGILASRRVEVVFAVYLKPRRAPVRAGVLDPTAEADTPAVFFPAPVFPAATAGKAVPAAVPSPRRPLSVALPVFVVSHAPHRHRHSAGL